MKFPLEDRIKLAEKHNIIEKNKVNAKTMKRDISTIAMDMISHMEGLDEKEKVVKLDTIKEFLINHIFKHNIEEEEVLTIFEDYLNKEDLVVKKLEMLKRSGLFDNEKS